jgi:hypothetical protein
VRDELVTRAADLVGVAIAGELEGPRDRGAIDPRRRLRGLAVARSSLLGAGRLELLDDREEVGE